MVSDVIRGAKNVNKPGKNQLIYNLIYFSWNVKGMILYKKTVWDIFGGQSSIKHTVASEMPG